MCLDLLCSSRSRHRSEAWDGSSDVCSSDLGGRGADSWLDRSLWERCITQGLPRISGRAYNSNLKIVQTPDHVALLHEPVHEVRIIPPEIRRASCRARV